MSAKQYNKGGQRRTSTVGCGWSCKGSPREVAGKLKIHRRVCAICKENDKKANDIPEFNRMVGEANGWGGINAKGKNITKSLTTVIDGSNGASVVSGCGNTAEERLQSVIEKILAKRRFAESGIDIDPEDIIIVE
jgi:hypothetical protein